MGKLDGKVTMVTGCARGIGKGIALLLGSEGAKVACADRDLKEGDHPFFEGSAETTASEIQAAGGSAVPLYVDTSREEDCANLVAKTREAFGPIDVLVNNAAYTFYLPVADYPIRKWFRSAAVNIHGYFMMTQMVLQDMIKRKSGAIVNISSGDAIGPGRGPYKESGTGTTMYGAEKAALERFTQGLAQEVYTHGISVTALSPAIGVQTPGSTYFREERIKAGLMDPNTPWEREPMEYMAKATLLLATEPLDKITGRVNYSQAILAEFGWIKEGHGTGVERPGSGFSQI